jgi:uncharacterized protein (TIGR03435 family)
MRIAIAISLLTTAIAAGQTPGPGAPLPAFEVASVKPNTSGDPGSRGQTGRGSATFTNTSTRMLIVNAYNIRAERVVGGPGWLDSERYDVTARAPEGTTDNQIPLMMRALLAERFKLATRTETRDEPVYALVLAREDGRLGPSLRRATECVKGGPSGGRAGGPGFAVPLLQPGQQAVCGVRSLSDGRMSVVQGGAVPLDRLANTLRGTGGREVVDRTGLSGNFDFDLRFAPEALRSAVADDDSNLPNVFTAVQEQLGLKLDAQRGPVEYLVIERVERPTPD